MREIRFTRNFGNGYNRFNLYQNLDWLNKREAHISVPINKIKELVNNLKTILENNYPDLWDIQFKFQQIEISNSSSGYDEDGEEIITTNRYITILTGIFAIIKFPVVNIKNTPGKVMTIHDLFIRIPFYFDSNNNKIKMERIQGCLLSPTKIQYSAGYCHSHLQRASSRDYFYQFRDFCTGSGDINVMQGDINSLFSDGKKNFDANILDMFFHHIKNFVSWESLEGTPYYRMSNVLRNKKSKLINISSQAKYYIFRDFINNLCIHKNNLDKLNWIIKDGYYQIKDDENFEDFLKNLVSDNLYCCFKDINGNYISNNYVENNTARNLTNSFIYFQRNKVNVTIKDEEINLEDSLKKYIHPQIKNYIKSKLENEYNKKKFKDNYFRTEN